MHTSAWVLYLCAQAAFLGLHFPTTRKLHRIICFIVFAVALLYVHVRLTLSSPGEDYVLGSSNGILFCAAFATVFLDNDFPDGLRRIKDEASSLPPSELSLRRKLTWMIDLGADSRRVGWSTQPKKSEDPSPPSPPTSILSRGIFVFSKLLLSMLYLVIFRITAENRTNKLSFDPHTHSPEDKLYITRKLLVFRGATVIAWAVGVAAEMSFLQAIFAAISVALEIYTPEDWPNLVRSPTGAFTVRRFWAKTWHQLLRVPLQKYGEFVAYRLLKLKRGTILSTYTKVIAIFSVSAIVHMFGDFAIQNSYGPTLLFFLLQPVALAVEDSIIRVFKNFGFKSRVVWKVIGYCWVYVWFSWCASPWLDSISAHGGNMRTMVIVSKIFEVMRI